MKLVCSRFTPHTPWSWKKSPPRRCVRYKHTFFPHSPQFPPESPKMAFFWHADAHNCGAVRAAPTRAGCAVFPAWSRGRQTSFARKILNVEPLNTIHTSQFPPEPPKMTFFLARRRANGRRRVPAAAATALCDSADSGVAGGAGACTQVASAGCHR